MDQIDIPAAFRNVNIAELDISVRLYNVLRSLGVSTLRDLGHFTTDDIFNVRNCGKKTLVELVNLLGERTVGDVGKDEEGFESPQIPEYLHDLPIKLVCEGSLFGGYLSSCGAKVLGDLSGREKAFCGTVQRKYRSEFRILLDRATSGEFDQFLSSDQPADVKATIVRSLHGPIRVAEAIHGVDITHVGASVRLSNVLESVNVKTFGQLQAFSFDQLKLADNCGVKSIFELWHFLMSSLKAETTESQSDVEQNVVGMVSQLSFVGWLEIINEYTHGMGDRDRRIFLDRLGGIAGQQARTLEEIGRDYSVTRERIRQIEAKHLRCVKRLMTGRAEKLYEDLLHECEAEICLLTAELLITKVRDNYSAFQYPPAFYLTLLRQLAPELPVFGAREGITQTRLDSVQFLIGEIKSLLQASNSYVTLGNVWDQIFDRSLVRKFGLSAFFDAVQSDHFQLMPGDSPQTLLISLKKLSLTSGQITLAILSESSVPLTPERIIERAVQKYGPDLDLPSPNSLANLPSYDSRFYLLDRRSLGLRQHFRLDSELWGRARTDFYNSLKKLGRPISTNEIFKDFRFDWAENSTANELAAILREDARFVDLGRLLFSLAEWRIASRESVKDLISRVLGESNRPLRASEIVERVRLYRSFSATSLPSMLRGHSEVEDVGFGYYGLKAKAPYTEFLCSEPLFLKRLVKRNGPISIRDLMRTLGLPADPATERSLRSTLESIPEIRLSPLAGEHTVVASFHRVFPRTK